MYIHEYQAKILLRHFGVPVPDFVVISTLDELERYLQETKIDQAVLKVQVHAGGRGKAGGVKIAHNREEIFQHARNLLGMQIINNQTGPQGVIANQLLITPLTDIKHEFYLGVVIDRQSARAMLIASPEGGVDIEEIAARSPEKILTFPITLDGKIRDYNLLRLVNFMGWKNGLIDQGKALALAVAKAFVETDASLLEINPLVETADGNLVVLDAKMSIDDNALFRQAKIAEFFDPTQLSTEEVKARAFDLAYVALDGNIGCMVNGAGLAMATMDIIHLCGGKPANFLDVGGGASTEKVSVAFKIILGDPKVKGILVNIFGGIMNCETLAAGIVAAANELQVTVPLVVRMEGTNVEQGRKTLADSKLNITIAHTLTEAAEKIVSAVNQGGSNGHSRQ